MPAHLSLRRLCASTIRGALLPGRGRATTDGQEFAGWVEGHARLDTLTQGNVSTGQQQQAGLFILAPLVSGILGALVPQAE